MYLYFNLSLLKIRVSRPSVSNFVELPPRRQSDLPMMPQVRRGSYGIMLEGIELERVPSFPLKKRMSQKLASGSNSFIRRLKMKPNVYKKGK